MKTIQTLLNERKNYLQRIKEEKEHALLHAPEGSLRICKQGNATYFHHRHSTTDLPDKYLRKEDFPTVKSLAQKDYDMKVLKSCTQELQAIEKYEQLLPSLTPESILKSLHKVKQNLVIPIEDTDENYILKWKSIEYKGKSFDENTPEYYTANGERVRSKSEVIIADLLARENIPYKYECPIILDHARTVYPDFTLLHVKKRKELLLEHFGRMDDPEYAEKALNKINTYERNGIYPGEQLIITHETFANPLNTKYLLNKIRHYFQ